LAWLLTWRVRYERLETIPKNFTAVQPLLTLPINWLPKGRVYDFFQKINNGVVLRSIRKTLKDHDVRNYVYINCYDPFFVGFLPKEMRAALSIYHCIDDISQNPYTAKHGTDLENEAVRNADVTLATSIKLKKLKQPFSDRVVAFFNAADIAVFQKAISEKYPRPAELEGRTGKVIGFIGNLDELRIDYVLLKKIALAHSDKTLLLVGPVNSEEPRAIGLDKLPNVVFAGSRRLEDLPPLLQHTDVALIPFLCNTLTESIYPLKINEYLAAGKPVVSTSFSDDIRSFADCIYLAENHESFLQLIDRAIFEDNPDLIRSRVETANSNTWEARIRQFWEIVETSTRQIAHSPNHSFIH